MALPCSRPIPSSARNVATATSGRGAGSVLSEKERGRRTLLLRVIAVGITILSVWMVVRGIHLEWFVNFHTQDLGIRFREYQWFARGVYPNPALIPPPIPPGVPFTVYPPYAMPMLALFFPGEGMIEGTAMLQAMSLAALVVMGVFGWRSLRFAGVEMAWIAAFAAGAMAGTSNVFNLGQFSIICTALVVLEIMFLQQRRATEAGVAWALSMLKPQNSLGFAALFCVRRQWQGGVVGGAVLLGLSLAACAWTGVSAGAMLEHWVFRIPAAMGAQSSLFGQSLAALGLPRAAGTYVAMTILMAGGITAAVILHRNSHRFSFLGLAGVCAVPMRVLLYHRFYDNIMLFPTLVALMVLAARRPDLPARLVLAGVAVSLLAPQRLLECHWSLLVLQIVVWLGAAGYLAWMEFTGRARLDPEC